MTMRQALIAVLLCAFTTGATAGVVSYQGRVELGGSPYSGPGYFKLAVVDAAGTTSVWSNDGTSSGGAEPAGAVTLSVTNGLFDVLLGDTSIANMNDLPAAAFPPGQARLLRVWFSTTGTPGSFAQLAPDRRIASVPFALQAGEAVNADTVDGLHASAFTYTNGSGLGLSGNVFSVSAGTGLTFSAGQVVVDFAGTGSATTAARSDHTHPVAGWQLTGNSGTIPGANFLGTTDTQPLLVKTAGAGALNERLRFLTTPQVVVNRTSTQAGDLLSVYGSGYAGATNSIANQTDYPINGYSTGAFAGIYGENVGAGQGVLGLNTSTGTGVYGENTNAAGYGVFGYNTAAGVAVGGLSTGGSGVLGSTTGAAGAGVRGVNQNASGTGVLALGNNITVATLPAAGAGLTANGTTYGVYSVGTNAATGVGLFAGGNNLSATNTPGNGAGVVGQAENFGVVGYASTPVAALADQKWGGYFDYLPGANTYTFVAGRFSGTDYGVLSAGTKSTIVRGLADEARVMFCPEAPEVLFMDFGSAQLAAGTARIDLDPVLAKNVLIDAAHPLRVFVQVEGECNGVYVTEKSASGFTVRELGGGRSAAPFVWQLVAARADAIDTATKSLSRFADLRFPEGPGRAEGRAVEPGASSAPAGAAAPRPARTRTW